jgi:U32 family peptidase
VIADDDRPGPADRCLRRYPSPVRILSPVGNPDEVAPLIEAGADEFYAGLFPKGWYERWGRGSWPNRRGPGPANVETLDELARLGDAAHTGDAEMYIAFNQQYYPDDQADFVLEIAEDALKRGIVDAFIVTDPGLLAALKDLGARVFASTVAVALNADAARFLVELGAERIILSRHLHLAEVQQLAEAVPDIELEVFLMNDNCYFEEGFCSTTHSMPGFGVYCMTPWELHVTDDRSGGGIVEPEERARWDFLVEEHREFLRHLGSRGHGEGKLKMPLGPCGLCAIPDLMDLGIHSGKIVGREANLFRKIRSVQAVRHIRDVYEETGDKRAAKSAAVEMRGDAKGCSSGYSCYYRSARDRSLIPLPTRPRGPRRPRRQ